MNSWPPPNREPVGVEKFKPGPFSRDFTVGKIVAIWALCYTVTILTTAIVVATSDWIDPDSQPPWFMGFSAIILWLPFIFGLSFVSKKYANGSIFETFGLRFKPIDLVGLPIGVLCQVVLVGVITWPFQKMFPERFSSQNVEQRARQLFDNAVGMWKIVLILVVVFGAPLVEELVYRGLINGGLRNRVSDLRALLTTAVWFAAIHGRVVELPGLFAFAIVLGLGFQLTRRLGFSILAHMSFNATGLILVALN